MGIYSIAPGRWSLRAGSGKDGDAQGSSYDSAAVGGGLGRTTMIPIEYMYFGHSPKGEQNVEPALALL